MHLYDKNWLHFWTRAEHFSKDLFNSFGKFWKTCKKMKALNGMSEIESAVKRIKSIQLGTEPPS